MALDAEKVEVAVTGAVYLAPAGTELPSSSTDSLPNSYQAVGYLSTDGITETPTADTQQIQAWQNGDVVRTVQTSHSVAYGFTMIETNDVSLDAYYGEVTGQGGTREVTGRPSERQVLVIETVDTERGEVRRRVAPVAQITERQPVTLTNSAETGYGVTMTCFPDSDGVKVYIHAAAEVS